MRFLYILLFYLCTVSVIAQHDHNHDDHSGHHHHHGEWELGGAVGAVPIFDEGVIVPGLHLHLLQQNKMVPRLMIGVGVEAVLDEHTHLNASLVFNYNIFKGLNFALAPGILWVKHHDDWESAYATHFELNYGFEFGQIHIGPVVEYSLSKLEQHMMVGIHVGLPF